MRDWKPSNWCEAEEAARQVADFIESQALQIIELKRENAKYQEWFKDNAAILASHRIGGYEFVEDTEESTG